MTQSDTAGTPSSPRGLKTPGKRLWEVVVERYELADHELAQLEEACHIRDTIDALRKQLKTDGLMIDSSQGERLHPAVAEIRQQQQSLARILATVDLPPLPEDDLPPARPVRSLGRKRAA